MLVPLSADLERQEAGFGGIEERQPLNIFNLNRLSCSPKLFNTMSALRTALYHLRYSCLTGSMES